MSAFDVIECPSDPCDAARERIRDLLTREPLNDPRPHVPADAEPKAVPWWPVFLAGLVIVAVAVSLIAEVL